METLDITNLKTKEYEKRKRKEQFKRKMNLLKLRILRKKIPENDPDTIQAHKDGVGEYRDYYIQNQYLQEGIGFTCVHVVSEDPEKQKYIYIGLIQSADNAEGLLELNVPLSEVIASVNGNLMLQETLRKERTILARNTYYEQIGEETEPLENHILYFGKPAFPVGRIEKDKNGKYSIIDSISTEMSDLLEKIKKDKETTQAMQEKDFVEIDLGGGIVVATQECWLEPGKGIQFGGINEEALRYKFQGEKSIPSSDKKYAYIGDVTIGKATTRNEEDGKIQFITPTMYRNVVFWSDNQNIIQYFLEKKFAGLPEALGQMFTELNILGAEENNELIYIGGIKIDKEGKCQMTKEVPDTIKEVTKEQKRKATENRTVIKFEDLQK